MCAINKFSFTEGHASRQVRFDVRGQQQQQQKRDRDRGQVNITCVCVCEHLILFSKVLGEFTSELQRRKKNATIAHEHTQSCERTMNVSGKDFRLITCKMGRIIAWTFDCVRVRSNVSFLYRSGSLGYIDIWSTADNCNKLLEWFCS